MSASYAGADGRIAAATAQGVGYWAYEQGTRLAHGDQDGSTADQIDDFRRRQDELMFRTVLVRKDVGGQRETVHFSVRTSARKKELDKRFFRPRSQWLLARKFERHPSARQAKLCLPPDISQL